MGQGQGAQHTRGHGTSSRAPASGAKLLTETPAPPPGRSMSMNTARQQQLLHAQLQSASVPLPPDLPTPHTMHHMASSCPPLPALGVARSYGESDVSGAASHMTVPALPLFTSHQRLLNPQPPAPDRVLSLQGENAAAPVKQNAMQGPHASHPFSSRVLGASGVAAFDDTPLSVLRTELGMKLGELDCVASGFVSIDKYCIIATTLASLSHVLMHQKSGDGEKNTAGALASPTPIFDQGAGLAEVGRGTGPTSPRGSSHNTAFSQREQTSAILELFSPPSSVYGLSSRSTPQGGASVAGAAVAAARSTSQQRGTIPEWLDLQKKVMSFRIADQMTQSLESTSGASCAWRGSRGEGSCVSAASPIERHLPDGHAHKNQASLGNDGEARLTIDDLHAITGNDEALHFFFRIVRKQMPELTKKLRVMSPSSVLEFYLLESALNVNPASSTASATFDLQGIKKVATHTAPFSNFYLKRMVDALPLSLSSMFSEGYLSPLEPVVAPYASCSAAQREDTEFFLSMDDRARMLQQHDVCAYCSAEVLLLHIGLLSNYASNILSSYSLFMMLACAKRLGDIRRLDAQTTNQELPHATPLDSDGIPVSVDGMEAFVENCCRVYETSCSADLEKIRRQYPNVFILSALNASVREKAPVVTIAVSTIVKLIYLFAGGIGSISADDRRGTAVLLESLTGSASASSARRPSPTESSFSSTSTSMLSSRTFAATGDSRGVASTRSATDGTDDVALEAALRISALSRLGMLSKLMGLDVTNGTDDASVGTARACAASWRVMFQFCGVLPYEKCPTDIREWIHLFPLYALDTPSKRALLHVHAMLCELRAVELLPVMRERVLMSASICLQKYQEREKEKTEQQQMDAEDDKTHTQQSGGSANRAKTSPPRGSPHDTKTAPQSVPSTVVRPTFASHDRGLEVSLGHGVCREFYELCATEAVSEHLPPLNVLRHVAEPRPATAEELDTIPGLAPYKRHLVIALRWLRAPVTPVRRGDELVAQVALRKSRRENGKGAGGCNGTLVSRTGGSAGVATAAGGTASGESSYDDDDDGDWWCSCGVAPVSLVAPNNDELPLSAPLNDAIQERQRRRSLFSSELTDEDDERVKTRETTATHDATTNETIKKKMSWRDVVKARGSHAASALSNVSTSLAVAEQRFTVLAVVSRYKPAPPGSAPTSAPHSPRRASLFDDGSVAAVPNDEEQYLVLNASAGSEAWDWSTHRVCSLTHHRRTRPPFRVAEDTTYAWTNPQYDLEADASRNANIPFTIGWLIGNTLANEVVFQAPLAPLAFRILARSIKYNTPVENLPLRPADLSLLGDRWISHVLEASLGQSEESIVEIFGLRTWQEEEDELERHALAGTMNSDVRSGSVRQRRTNALRRVVRAIANELCWNVQSDVLLSRLFWSEVLRGLQSTSLASASLLTQCCARTIRTVLCGRIDSVGANFSFREQFLFFFDMCSYRTSYHSALSKATVRCMDEDLTASEKRELLRFITGRSLLPALPKTEFLQIVFAETDPLVSPSACDRAMNRLPSSFTCDNVIIIPNYFCCLLLGTHSLFVQRHVHPDVQKDYGIVPADFSTAWGLMTATEREQLCEDYRAVLGQRLRTAVRESGTLDGLDDPRGTSMSEVAAEPLSRAGFRRSIAASANGSLGGAGGAMTRQTLVGSRMTSTQASPVLATSADDRVFPTRDGADAHSSEPADLINLLGGTLFDDIAEEELVINGRQLVTKAAATTRTTEEAGDYYRLLVAHAKKMKIEEEAEESASTGLDSSQSVSSGSAQSKKPKRTVQQGAVLYNDVDDKGRPAEDHNEWVPRIFHPAQNDAELVSPKRKPASPPRKKKTTTIDEPASEPRTHTAASFALPSSVSGSVADDTAAAPFEARRTVGARSLGASGSHATSGHRASTLEDDAAAAAFIAQTEALVGRTSGAGLDTALMSSALALHRSPRTPPLRSGSLIDATGTADLAGVAAPSSHEKADRKPVAPRVRKEMPSALRELTARFDHLRRKSPTDTHPDNSSPAYRNDRAKASLSMSPSDGLQWARQSVPFLPLTGGTTQQGSTRTSVTQLSAHASSQRRSSVDKAISELFPDSIDF